MQEHVMIHIIKQHWNMQKYLAKVKYKRTWSKLRSKLNNKHEINKKVKWDQKEMSRLGRQPKSQQEKRPKLLWLGTTHAHAWAQSKIYPVVKETKKKIGPWQLLAVILFILGETVALTNLSQSSRFKQAKPQKPMFGRHLHFMQACVQAEAHSISTSMDLNWANSSCKT